MGLGFMFHLDTFQGFMMFLHTLFLLLESLLPMPTGKTPIHPPSPLSALSSPGNLPSPPQAHSRVLFRTPAQCSPFAVDCFLPYFYCLYLCYPHTFPSFTSPTFFAQVPPSSGDHLSAFTENCFTQDAPQRLPSLSHLLMHFLYCLPS